MKAKRALAALLAAFLLLPLFSGCSAHGDPVRVTLVLKTEASVAEFWEMLLSGVNAAAEEYGVELTTVTSSTETAIDEYIAKCTRRAKPSEPARSTYRKRRDG